MTTIPAHPPAAERAPLRLRAVLGNLAIAAGSLLAFTFFIILYAVGPKFEEIFREFGTPPSPLAGVFLSVARLLASIGPIGTVAAAAAAGGAIILVGRAGRRSPALLTLLVLVPLAMFPLFLLAVFEPLSAMIESLRASTP